MSLIAFTINSSAQALHSGKAAFTMQKDQIVQNNYIAKAVSATKLTSNYESPANLFQSADISFKFAINGRDNEMASGQDHHFTVTAKDGYAETPVIVFGKQLNQHADKKQYLQPNTTLKVRLDGREILNQFANKGYYTCFNGTKIYKQDFKGIYIAGGTLPMIWDFDNLIHRDALLLKDTKGDGIFETELILNVKQDQKQIAAEWNLSKDISAFPQYHSNFQLSNAIYNMSLEEMIRAVEPDSTFRTGKEWAGVWTRDISYSIILSMAYLQPQVAKNSLLKKVNKKKRIIQDTGTGGAYPASTDRMIWAVAAWEVYTATGDKDWLQLAYEIIKNSIEDDQKNCYDPITGMVKGESSFLDWREQTYPKWMQPADIFESECLGTNAAHYQANIVLSKMAAKLGQKDVSAKHLTLAEKIKKGINQYLWIPEKGYYAQFLYGRNYKIVSPRSEALGEALCVLFGIADKKRAEQIISSVPLTQYGISCIYPQIPNIPPYHNNAVWPFVQTYWALASAKSGNEAAVMQSIQSIYRPAALFLTNKENFVADNGDYAGTQINSSNMLWSLSGNLSLIHKLIFGVSFHSDSLAFSPFVPKLYDGEKTLTNFKYRNAVLDIRLEGTGNTIKTFLFDGTKQSRAIIPQNLTGHHSILIIMANTPIPAKPIHQTENYTSLAAPIVQQFKNQLQWQPVEGATSYEVLKNGKKIASLKQLEYTITESAVFSEYQIIALDKNQVPSFASEPIQVYNSKKAIQFEAELNTQKSDLPYLGYAGNGFVETSKTINPTLSFPIEVSEDGLYAIDFQYANGNGPTNTENKCAIRSLLVNKEFKGTIILPQRGTKEWSNWGSSNSVHVKLLKGKHLIQLSLEDHNDNMNLEINQAMIDFLRIIKLD
ncbi:MAG: hypothetical protein K2Q21_10530 [Chitinophagaceae bacterium]|nr:hypothetical protein [Chitinophagaceae bacterium]